MGNDGNFDGENDQVSLSCQGDGSACERSYPSNLLEVEEFCRRSEHRKCPFFSGFTKYVPGRVPGKISCAFVVGE